MSEVQATLDERQILLSKLLDAVKQCQIRFGGRTELATDGDGNVANLCHLLESILQHGMRKNYTGLAAIKHVTEIVTGINLRNVDEEPVFWHVIREHLTKHEYERYTLLKNISTDAGRGRAWLRSALNEHSLERYIHMLLSDPSILAQYYEESAFLLDQEKSSTLPIMAAGLGSILFAIKIDNAELNTPMNVESVNNALSLANSDDDPKPVYVNSNDEDIKLKRKKKKKPLAQIVSFDEDDLTESSRCVPVSPSYFSAPPSCISSPMQCTDNVTNIESKYSIAKTTVNVPAIVKENEAMDRTNPGYVNSWTTEQSLAVDSDIDCSGSCEELLPANSSRERGAGKETNIPSVVLLTESSPDNVDVKDVQEIKDEEEDAGTRRLSPHEKKHSSAPMNSRTVLTPVDDATVGELILVPIGEEVHSEDSVSLPSYSEDSECAAAALALQKVLNNSNSGLQLHVDSSVQSAGKGERSESLSNSDLRHAIIALMQKKEELDEQNKSLRNLLDREMEMCAGLRVEMDELKQKHLDKLEKLQNKIQALTRENELLKHQLRKYVGAVQMLKRDGSKPNEALACLTGDSNSALPEQKPYIDYHLEATEYERKLIQVAEMHGELMEFNERLHRLLSQKESVVRRLREELIDLRGPLPDDNQTSDDDVSITSDYDTSSMSAATRALINIWIPSAFLTGKSSDTHHVYQIFIRIRDDEWNIYRRYAQFYMLHKSLKKKNPLVNTFEFPPKKAIGNKDAKFVEERRKRLQHYLRCLVNLFIQNHAELGNSPDREMLIGLLPFFGDLPTSEEPSTHRRSRNPFSRFSSSGPATEQQDHHYTGL